MSPMDDIPPSVNSCDVFLIDTTTDLVVETSALLEPSIDGHERLNLPTFAFYINNTRSKQRVLFDMGSRKDWWNLPPPVQESIKGKGVPGIRIVKGIDDILPTGGVALETINAVIWSHHHWDHIGDIQKFPSSTMVVVGTGFSKTYLPGYPSNTHAPFYENDMVGRIVRELDFDDHQRSLQIGQLRAYDYFGDRSFYLLSTPGHTSEHLSGLVRTTPDTFVFLGGDICHFPGAYRPNPIIPMPETIPSSTRLDLSLPRPCPCSLFTSCHPVKTTDARTSPFYRPSSKSTSWYEDAPLAARSIDSMLDFDVDDNVFVAIAHDPGLREVCEMFPSGTMNDWKAKKWKDQIYWHFVNELPRDGKPGRPQLVSGRIRS